MSYYTYIIYSETKDRFYTGSTGNLEKRLVRHNKGSVRSTKSGIPWKLVYFEEFDTRSAAVIFEKRIKRMKSREYIKSLINKSQAGSFRLR